jgi:hypothetical protein
VESTTSELLIRVSRTKVPKSFVAVNGFFITPVILNMTWLSMKALLATAMLEIIICCPIIVQLAAEFKLSEKA